jgi:flagellar basal body P-ring formation protein FlgA
MKMNALRAAAIAAVVLVAGGVEAFAQQQVTLRHAIEASGPAVTLGDFFENAGAASGRAVAPAPTSGRTATFSPRFVQAAANAAGLDWTPPRGMTAILVSGRGGNGPSARFQTTSTPTGDVAVRRGEIITLVHVAPGLQLTTRARAVADGGVGDTVRVVNLQSNRSVDAVVTGVGAATASAN